MAKIEGVVPPTPTMPQRRVPEHASTCPVCGHDTYAYERHCHVCGADRWAEEPECPDCGSSDVVFVWEDADEYEGDGPATRRGCKGCGNMVKLDA